MRIKIGLSISYVEPVARNELTKCSVISPFWLGQSDRIPASDLNGHSYQSYGVRVRHGGRARRNSGERLETGEAQSRSGAHAVHRLGDFAKKYGLRAGDFADTQDVVVESIAEAMSTQTPD
jgi:hypothetical protein